MAPSGRWRMLVIYTFPPQDRPLAQRMLDGELDRQQRLKAELGRDPKTSAWIEDKRVPELQAAPVLRHARALFQSDPSRRARRGEVRACAAERRAGHDHRGSS